MYADKHYIISSSSSGNNVSLSACTIHDCDFRTRNLILYVCLIVLPCVVDDGDEHTTTNHDEQKQQQTNNDEQPKEERGETG